MGDIKGEFQADELTGTFDALNETTNVRPSKGESTSIVHPTFKTGYDTNSIDSRSETLGDGDPQILGPLSGNGVFKPHDIDTKGSLIVDDKHFMPGGGGDSLTGNGRPMNIWGNGGASTFVDRMTGYFDSNDVVICNGIDPDIQRPTHPNDNVGGKSGPGGTSFMTRQFDMPTDNLESIPAGPVTCGTSF